MQFPRKGVEFIARKAYPNGARGECQNRACELFGRGKDVSQQEYVQWILEQSWPRCKKCGKKITIEPIRGVDNF